MTAEMLLNHINAGGINKELHLLYPDSVGFHSKRYSYIVTEIMRVFGAQGEIMLFSAPGRTEIAGNHTDHQRGKVVAGAVSLDVIAAVEPTNDNVIRIKSQGHKLCEVRLDELCEVDNEEGSATSLVRGIAFKIAQLGFKLKGFNAFTTSMVLRGSGLSSSAAFEVLIATIINHLCCDASLSALEIAQISQWAENVYYKKPCGLMDQTACAIGSVVAIDFGDPQKPQLKSIDFDLEKYGYKLVIVNTKGNHGDLTEDYASIPSEMKMVANIFSKQYLREVDEAEFFAEILRVREKVGDRATLRAIHFFEENNRVDEVALALQSGDIAEFFRLVRQSGESSMSNLQNIYSTKSPQEQGISVGLALSRKFLGDEGACRVHGGGFAGTIVAYVKREKVEQYKALLDGVFGEKSCYVVSLRKVGGVLVY